MTQEEIEKTIKAAFLADAAKAKEAWVNENCVIGSGVPGNKCELTEDEKRRIAESIRECARKIHEGRIPSETE